MNSPGSSLEPSSNVDISQLSKLSDKDKQELQQFIMNETQKARIQQTVHSLTDICWKKCITATIRNGKLEHGEETCTQNCVDRFLDANTTAVKHLQKLQQSL